MFSESDYDKLQQIMEESPENHDLLTRLLESHQMTISTISHEIRNPLTLIYSTLQLISSQHPEVHSFKYWDQLTEDVEYTKLLLEELSLYNNGGHLSCKEIDTDSFFKSISLSFAASIVDTDIEFISRIQPDLPVLNCDMTKLRQSLLNLLNNAEDAVISCKNVNPQITFEVYTVETSLHSSTICAKISDNGCGIAPEYMEHIFEPFTTYKSGGTGLGLAIASRIAKAHGGSLTASSAPGELTVFTLTLPIQADRQ